MALSDIIAAISAELVARTPGVEVLDGPEHLGVQGAPPRVVFVPVSEDLAGAVEIHYDEAAFPAVGSARPLAQRNATVEVHLWGKDRAAAETLIQSFVNATRRAAGAAYQLGRGMWKQQDGSAVAHLGRAYVLEVTFKIPVLEEGQRFASVTSTDQTDTVIGATT